MTHTYRKPSDHPFPLLGGEGTAEQPFTLPCGHPGAKALPACIIRGPRRFTYGYVIECLTCDRRSWLAHDWRRIGHATFDRTPEDRPQVIDLDLSQPTGEGVREL